MRPESIGRLVRAHEVLEQAKNSLASTRIAERDPLRQCWHNLGDQYEAQGLSLNERERIGLTLQGRLNRLLGMLWEANARTAVPTPDGLVKRLEAPGFVPLRLTRPADQTDSCVKLTDEREYWSLLSQATDASTVSMMADPSSAVSHALIMDDIDTVTNIFQTLGIELPQDTLTEQ